MSRSLFKEQTYHISNSMSNINYQEKLTLISTGLADILSCLQHMSSSQLEIKNKVKNIHALGVKTRAKELSVIHEVIDLLTEKIRNMLNHTKCKSFVMHTLNTNMAESGHEERKKNFELLSRNVIVTHDNSSYGK